MMFSIKYFLPMIIAGLGGIMAAKHLWVSTEPVEVKHPTKMVMFDQEVNFS